MNYKTVIASACGSLIILVAVLLPDSAISGKTLLRPGDAALVASGKQIYKEQCASCHGANLEGQPNWRVRLPNGRLPAPPHDQSGHSWHHTDDILFKITKLGSAALVGGGYESDMRGFDEELSDEKIIAVLSYIKSTWPDFIRKRHDDMNKSAGNQ